MEEKLLARVRALLAKVEATDYPDEAEAFTAKASELIAKYGIDEAMLAAAGGRADEIKQSKILIAAPYSSEKATLLGGIARSLRCKTVRWGCGRNVEYCTIVGYGVDLERVELLHTSLLLQASGQVTRQRPPCVSDGRANVTRSDQRSHKYPLCERYPSKATRY